MQHRQTASVPASGDAGRHGRRASPTNPTNQLDGEEEKLSAKIDLRCTDAEKAEIKKKAKAAGVSASQLLREVLGLAETKRRKPVPDVSPEVAMAVGRSTRDVQRLARDARRRMSEQTGMQQLETTALIAALILMERSISELLELGSPEDKS